ncbi:MAG TPA: hypothetical protein VK427_02860, partial [Kofleriaceae bacterium]|nr:hypothetical protein [Kofleriaceae bacterium]
PAEIANIKTDLEMQRYIDRASREMKEGFVAINADFTAVESWVTLAETRPNQVATKDPVVPPPAPSPESPPPPGNPGQMGAGGTTPNPPR